MALEKPAVPGGNSQPAANPSLGNQNAPKPAQNQPLQQVQAKSAPQTNLAAQAGLGSQAPRTPAPKSSSNRGVWIAIILVGVLSLGSTSVLGFLTFNTGAQINSVAAELEQKMQEQLTTLQTSVSNLEATTGNFNQVSESVQTLEEQAADFPTKEDVENNAEIHKQTDSDLDGISNYDEVITFGTDPNEKDTDGDGFNDKAEIDNGFNPAGDGELVLNSDGEVTTDSSDTSTSATNSTSSTSDATSVDSDTATDSTSTAPNTSTTTDSSSSSASTDSSTGSQAFGN